MDPRVPDPSYRMRLIDDGFDDPDEHFYNLPNTYEIEQLEEIEMRHIEQLEIEELEMMQIKELEVMSQSIIESKKDTIKNLVEKLNIIKSRSCLLDQTQSNKFELLDKKLNEYLNTTDPDVKIDEELNNFIIWLCTKTLFSRYKFEDLLKKIFVVK